jgi:hypothetical protein
VHKRECKGLRDAVQPRGHSHRSRAVLKAKSDEPYVAPRGPAAVPARSGGVLRSCHAFIDMKPANSYVITCIYSSHSCTSGVTETNARVHGERPCALYLPRRSIFVAHQCRIPSTSAYVLPFHLDVEVSQVVRLGMNRERVALAVRGFPQQDGVEPSEEHGHAWMIGVIYHVEKRRVRRENGREATRGHDAPHTRSHGPIPVLSRRNGFDQRARRVGMCVLAGGRRRHAVTDHPCGCCYTCTADRLRSRRRWSGEENRCQVDVQCWSISPKKTVRTMKSRPASSRWMRCCHLCRA